jgi:phage terminase large subunit
LRTKNRCMSRAVKFDLTGEKSNRKQIEFIRAVFDKRRIETTYAYGGAVRGGKTFVILYCLHLLCRNYPGSKWVVVREDLPALKTTTIPSFNKLIEADKYGKWNYSTPITFKYTNGSQIIFKPESINNRQGTTFFPWFRM